jgi:hypothetical protein
MVPIPDLAKHFFHGPALVPVPTSLSQLRSRLQKPDPEPPVFTPSNRYPDNTGANDLLVGSTVVLPNFLKIQGKFEV